MSPREHASCTVDRREAGGIEATGAPGGLDFVFVFPAHALGIRPQVEQEVGVAYLVRLEAHVADDIEAGGPLAAVAAMDHVVAEVWTARPEAAVGVDRPDVRVKAIQGHHQRGCALDELAIEPLLRAIELLLDLGDAGCNARSDARWDGCSRLIEARDQFLDLTTERLGVLGAHAVPGAFDDDEFAVGDGTRQLYGAADSRDLVVLPDDRERRHR